MSITAYKIITGTAETLSEAVAASIGSWQPFGGPVNLNGYLMQTLIQGAPSEGVPPDSVPLANGATVVVKNSAGTTIAGTHTAVVTAGALTNVKLAATVAAIANGAALTVPVTGIYTATATVSVAAGVVTGIALS